MRVEYVVVSIIIVLVVLLIIFIGLEVFARLYEAFIRVADVFIIFGAAWAFAYLLSPLVNATERRTRLNRVGAVFVVYAAIAVVFGGILAIAVPGLAGQLDSLRSRAPELAANTADAAKGLQEQLDRAGVPVNPGDVRRIPARPSVPAVIEGEDRVPLPDEPKDRLDMSADVLRVAVEEEDRPAGDPVARGQEPPVERHAVLRCEPDVLAGGVLQSRHRNVIPRRVEEGGTAPRRR